MEVRTLELNIISAQGLKKVSTFGHDTCYAVAYIYSNEKMATGVDRDGGENPTWNEKLKLTCDDKLLRHGRSYITVEIYSYGTFSNTLVGTAKISLLDVGKGRVEEPQFMAYEVGRPSGKVRGVLNVSIKVGEKRTMNQKNHSKQGLDFLTSDPEKKPRQDVPALTGYGQAYPPVQAHPPPRWVTEEGTAVAFPPPTNSNDYNAANTGFSVYPPPKSSERAESVPNNGGSVYPPPKPTGYSSATSTSKKEEEPVLAYPASGVAGAYPPSHYGQQYGPQHYGSGYAPGPQGYYYPSSQPPYGYQQQYQYSKPPKHRGSSSSGSSGLGLLGGLLGGLLVGEVIGGIF